MTFVGVMWGLTELCCFISLLLLPDLSYHIIPVPPVECVSLHHDSSYQYVTVATTGSKLDWAYCKVSDGHDRSCKLDTCVGVAGNNRCHHAFKVEYKVPLGATEIVVRDLVCSISLLIP